MDSRQASSFLAGQALSPIPAPCHAEFREKSGLARHSKNHGYDSAHLIVISGQPDKSVRNRVEHYARTRGVTVEFLLYRVQTELLPHP